MTEAIGFLSYEDIDDTGGLNVPKLCSECGRKETDCACSEIFTTWPDIEADPEETA